MFSDNISARVDGLVNIRRSPVRLSGHGGLFSSPSVKMPCVVAKRCLSQSR